MKMLPITIIIAKFARIYIKDKNNAPLVMGKQT